MAVKFTNNAATTLAAGINSSVTSISVTDGSVFPALTGSDHFYVTFDDTTNREIVKVTARSGNTLTVVRGQDNTTAQAFNSGDKAELRVVAALLEDITTEVTSTLSVDTFTGDGTTTAFTLSQAPSSEDNLIVFIEGAYQNPGDFVLSGTTLTLDEAPVEERNIIVYHVKGAVSGNNLNQDSFTADGNTAAFTLSIAPIHENNTQVFIDGVYQQKNSYSISGTTLTLDANPSNGATVEVMTFTQTEVNTLPASFVSGLTEVTAVGADHFMIFDATDSALKKSLVSDVLESATSISTSADATAITIDSSENVTFTNNVTINSGQLTAGGLAYPTSDGTNGQVLTTSGSGTLSFTTIDTSISANSVGITELNVSDGTNGQVLTTDGAGTLSFSTVSGGATDINGLSDAKTFGTGSIMLGDTTTGTLSNANYNVGVGVDMLNSLTSGYANIAIGFESCKDLTTGHNNVAVGHATLYENIGGEQNVAIGANAMQNNTSGYYNVAVGKSALVANTTGYDNVAIGYKALDALTTGYLNIAIGANAATASTGTVYSNTVVGANAATAMTSGIQNTCIGQGASQLGTSASQTTSVGVGANLRLSTGNENTSIGYLAGENITSGYSNVCIGSLAGDHVTGNNNVTIGRNANGGGGGARSFAITIGPGLLSAGDYFTTFGEGSGANRVYNKYNANATWTKASDLRYKEEIADNTDCGLAFINDLRPVTYKWKPRANIDSSLPDYNPNETERQVDEKMYGLIAQEVKQAMDNHNITDFAGWDEAENGIQGISQEMFVHPLIKAVQELSAKCDSLQNEINILKGN